LKKGKISFSKKQFDELSQYSGYDMRLIVARDIHDVIDRAMA
jgi:hypothetical protein